jgi:hypothetical protein
MVGHTWALQARLDADPKWIYSKRQSDSFRRLKVVPQCLAQAKATFGIADEQRGLTSFPVERRSKARKLLPAKPTER